MDLFEQIIYAVLCILYLFGHATGYLAARKGHPQIVWFLLGFFFNVVALIAILIIPAKGMWARRSHTSQRDITKTYDLNRKDQGGERLDISFD